MGGSATDATATLGFNNGFIFVMIGMLGGIMMLAGIGAVVTMKKRK